MRKLLLGGILLVVAVVVACDTKDPSGPATVTISGPSPITTTTTTSTSIPTTTSTTSTTTSTIPHALARTYISLGIVPPNVPNSLSLSLKQTAGVGNSASSWRDFLPIFRTAVEFAVLGFYTTSGGGSGAVQGNLSGTLEAGTFTGKLTSVTPECTAEREFSGSVDTQALRWVGGMTLKDCKGSPLAFSPLTMLATTAPPPITPPPPVTTTIPLACGFGLSASAASFTLAGGTGGVDLTTGPTCAWTTQRFVDWVTVQPAAATGPARITFIVAPGGPRTTTLVLAGQPFVIDQK